MRCLTFFIVLMTLSPACKKSSGGSSSTAAVKTVTTVEANVETTLQAPAGAGVASVLIPAGTLAVSTDVILEKGQNFVDSSVPNEVILPGGMTVPSVSSGLIIRPAEDVALKGPLTITLAAPAASLWLANEELVIYYKYRDPVTQELTVGLKTAVDQDMVLAADGSVSFQGYFGIYWAARLSRGLTSDELPKPHSSEIPVVGATGIAVITTQGIVSESILNGVSDNVWLQDFSQPGILHNPRDIAANSKLVLLPNGTGFLSAGVGSTALSWTWSNQELAAEFAQDLGHIGFKGTKKADGSYDIFWKKPNGSFEAEAESLSLLSLAKFKTIRITAGDIHAINFANRLDSHAEVLQFNANGTTTYLTSVDDTGFTWSQSSGVLIMKYGEEQTFRITVLSTDKSQAPIYAITQAVADGKEYFATNLGSRLSYGWNSSAFTDAIATGEFESSLFLDDGNYVFGDNHRGTKTDRENQQVKFYWQVGNNKLIARQYTALDGTEALDLEACYNKTIVCKEIEGWQWTMLNAGNGNQIVLQQFYRDGSDEPYRSLIDNLIKK